MTHRLPDRRLSLLTPSGHLTLGNHLGALRAMTDPDPGSDCVYGDGVFAAGAQRCREETEPVLAAARTAMGL